MMLQLCVQDMNRLATAVERLNSGHIWLLITWKICYMQLSNFHHSISPISNSNHVRPQHFHLLPVSPAQLQNGVLFILTVRILIFKQITDWRVLNIKSQKFVALLWALCWMIWCILRYFLQITECNGLSWKMTTVRGRSISDWNMVMCDR